MASGKSKYVVADQNTYSNVGAAVGQAKRSEEQTNAINNFAMTSQQINNSNIPNLSNAITNEYQQSTQQVNYQPQAYNNITQNIQQANYSQPQQNIYYQNNSYSNLVNNNQQYPTSQPVVNEFIENQTKHVSADQLLDDYGLNNTIRVEDDSYNFNIDDQMSNSKDIYYNGPITNNANDQQIVITHKNLDYKKRKNNEVHTNSFTKGANYIPPQRKPNPKGSNKFQKKMKRHNIFFNLLLFVIYILIFGVVGYLGYNYYVDQQQFFFSRETVKIVEGTTFEETIYIKNKVQKNENYTFKSNDENIATIDKSGVITAIAPGSTTIDVISKDEKHSGKIEVEVISLEIKSFKLEQAEKKMYLDNTYTIVPIINGERDIIIDLDWQSSNENIITVSTSGIVTAHNVGIAEIIVSIPNTKYKAKVLIQVKK